MGVLNNAIANLMQQIQQMNLGGQRNNTGYRQNNNRQFQPFNASNANQSNQPWRQTIKEKMA